MSTIEYNIADYGAMADGVTKNTSAIQQAIDDCTQADGGRVVIPAGTYVSGTIFLKSHVELHLVAGAVLLASPDREDYNAGKVFPENKEFVQEKVSNAHLIMAYRAENIAITGLGTINGSSSCFFETLHPWRRENALRERANDFFIKEWRPGQMVYFCLCRRIAVHDVKLIDSPYWTLLLHGCEDAQIRGLTISNATRNGDGIDIDCSRNVTVSDCIIRVGDDCITFRANDQHFQEADRKPCENVTVTNCVLSGVHCGIRVGVGSGTIRRCTFSGNIITDSRVGINLISRFNSKQKLPAGAVPEGKALGARIEQIQFMDCRIDAVNPIVMELGAGAVKPAAIRDISFSQMKIIGSSCSELVGSAENPLQRIKFHDVDWKVREDAERKPQLPCALYGVHLEDVELQNFRIRWEEPGAAWRDGLMLEHVNHLQLHQVALRQPQADSEGAALHLRACDDISLQGCRAEKGTSTFLRMTDSTGEGKLRVIGCDLSESEQPFDVDGQINEAGNLYGGMQTAAQDEAARPMPRIVNAGILP